MAAASAPEARAPGGLHATASSKISVPWMVSSPAFVESTAAAPFSTVRSHSPFVRGFFYVTGWKSSQRGVEPSGQTGRARPVLEKAFALPVRLLPASMTGPLEARVVVHALHVPKLPEVVSWLSHSGDVVGSFWDAHPAHLVFVTRRHCDVGSGVFVHERHDRF